MSNEEEQPKNDGTDVTNLQTLKNSRAGYKGVLTKKRNELRALLPTAHKDDIQAKITDLSCAFERFQESHSELHQQLTDDEAIEESYLYFDRESKLMRDMMDSAREAQERQSQPHDNEVFPKDSASQVGSKGSSSAQSVAERLTEELAKRRALEARVKFLEDEQALAAKKFKLQRRHEEETFFLTQEEKMLKAKSELCQSMAREEVYAHAGAQEHDGQIHTFSGLNPLTAPWMPPSGEKYRPESSPHSSGAAYDESLSKLMEFQDEQRQCMKRLVESRSSEVAALTLPRPTVPIFDGNPLEYLLFSSAFRSLIEAKTTSPSTKLYYLVQYTSGEVQELMKGCLARDPEEGYEEAKTLLSKHYGQPYKIAAAYANRLTNGPPIKGDDTEGLRKFSILLTSTLNTLKEVGYTSQIENPDSLRRIIFRLPFDMRRRWRTRADDISEVHNREIRFDDIAKFVGTEARVASHPLFGDLMERGTTQRANNEKDKETSTMRSKPYSTFATNASQNEIRPSSTTSMPRCAFCDGEHYLPSCLQFQEKSYDDRIAFAKDNSLCFNCLRSFPRHRAMDCRDTCVCEKCGRRHHTLLHTDNFINARTAFTNSNTTAHVKICLPIVPVKVKARGQSTTLLTYALLDNCSNTTFCTESLLKRLGPSPIDHYEQATYSLTTMEKERSFCTSSVTQLEVFDFDEKNLVELPKVYSRPVLPVGRESIPKQSDVCIWPYLQDLHLHCISSNVDLLIGNDCHSALEPIELRRGESGGPFAVRTLLGWTINGPLGRTDSRLSHARVCNFTTTDDLLSQQFQKFCDREYHDCLANGEDVPMSQCDLQALRIMQSSAHVEQNHYVIDLPFKYSPPQVPNNRIVVEHRLKLLKRKFDRNPDLYDEYAGFMSNLVTQGYAEQVPDNEIERNDGQVWYLPHHSVYHPQKKKIRVVFDCSSEYRGVSLNQQLLQGPDQTSSLVGVLLRFRQCHVAMMADIESMFHRVFVSRSQRDMLRFLWWSTTDTNSAPTVFRMLVHLFGATSSPSVCCFALRKTPEDNGHLFDDRVSTTVQRNFYVDDVLKSVDQVDEAIQLAKHVTTLLSMGGFRLTKWASNSIEVMRSVPESERAVAVRDLSFETLPVEQALGVYWDMHADTLGFRVTIPERASTRRGILSMTSSVYDPLGFIAPVVLPVRMLLQELCRRGLAWDDPIPSDCLDRWNAWLSEVPTLAGISIARCVKPKGFGTIRSYTLHHFTDASTHGYGAVSYLRMENEHGGIHCVFVMGKSRLTPLKPVTIPRLELSAATVAIKLDQLVKGELELPITNSTFWTDSTSVLKYVKNETRRFHTYVANRISAIREASQPSQWRFISGDANPADDASRGLSPRQFLRNDRWRRGPEFLWQSEASWTNEYDPAGDLTEDDPEVKREKLVFVSIADDEPSAFEALISGNSSWGRLKRVTAWILRFLDNARSSSKNHTHARVGGAVRIRPLSVVELTSAETAILKFTQVKYFPDECGRLNGGDNHDVASKTPRLVKKSSSLFSLDPAMTNGLLRVGGRLTRATIPENAKRQIILPKDGHVTGLIVRHYHAMSAHSGREHVLALIRGKFWIIHANAAVRRVLSGCVSCKRRQGVPLNQKMSDLPPDRVQADKPPFTFVGVDFFGPFHVKRGRGQIKRYGCIFTCLTTRAVHLEVAFSLDTDSFLNSLRRFLSRRGNSLEIVRSDNGTNFVAGDREIRSCIAQWNQERIGSFLLQREIDWKFNPPGASHHGGVWERCIRTVRKVLMALLTEQRLDDEGLSTLFCEAEAIVNSRPITTVSNDVRDLEPLTPNHLLLLRSGPPLPPGVFTKDDLYTRRRWRHVQYMANQFWVRWRKEYLPLLQTRQKWSRPRRDLRQDDVVLLTDSGSARGSWPLARVIRVSQGSDGHVRSVTVKTKSTVLTRPITKCVLLLEADERAE